MSRAAVAAAELLKKLGADKAEAGLILGSGLGNYASLLEDPVVLNYADIPGFPVSSVPGHANRFVYGKRCGRKVLVMQGRFHYYEGYPMDMVAAGAQTMIRLGIPNLLITNAAGCINTAWKAGELMLISDHINYSGANPLIGPNDDALGLRFPDMTVAYDAEFRKKTRALAEKEGITLREGVYMMFSGPTFETPAEIRMARVFGADAAGMSTVPEVIEARHGGMRVLGISLMANMAAGVLPRPLSHQEVNETAALAEPVFTRLVDGILREVF